MAGSGKIFSRGELARFGLDGLWKLVGDERTALKWFMGVRWGEGQNIRLAFGLAMWVLGQDSCFVTSVFGLRQLP